MKFACCIDHTDAVGKLLLMVELAHQGCFHLGMSAANEQKKGTELIDN